MLWKYVCIIFLKLNMARCDIFSISSSCKNCCAIAIGPTSTPVQELHQHSSHTNHTRTRLLWDSFTKTIFPNANYCSPDMRHKHTTALNIETSRLVDGSQLWCHSFQHLFTSHTSSISQAGAQWWPFKCHIRTLFSCGSSQHAFSIVQCPPAVWLSVLCALVWKRGNTLCTICHLIIGRIAFWGWGSKESAEGLD